MNLIYNIFPVKLIDSIGMVIIHSIWQGALVAGLAALLLFFFRQYGSRIRYGIGVVSLLLMFFLSILTFHMVYNNSPQDKQPLNNIESRPIPSQITAESGGVSLEADRVSSPGIWLSISSFLNSKISRALPLVVAVWFVMVLFLMFKSTVGLIVNQRLRPRASRNLKKFWQERLKMLSEKTRVKQPVLLAESDRVKSPVTIGFLKPVILLPLGLILSLPQDEVEAVLAHELAHIARKDYLVNMLQHLIEILFFYHPAIRWVSAIIRCERENCCDDIAVAVCGNSLPVARALSNIAETGRENPVLAQAAANSNWRLLKRIKRLLTPPEKDYRAGVSSIVIFFLVISFLTVLLSANVTLNFGMEMKKSGGMDVTERKPSEEDMDDEGMDLKKSNPRITSRRFIIKNDTYVKIGGKIKIKKGVIIYCRLVDVKSKKIIWKYTVEKKGDGIQPFAGRIFLKKGTYDLEMNKNCQEVYLKDLKLNSNNILFSTTREDEEDVSERELEHKMQELIQRERALAKREKEIRMREQALSRINSQKLSEERKILEKEAAERARMEEEQFERQKRVLKKEEELALDREKMQEYQEQEKRIMEEELSKIKDEILKLNKRGAIISTQLLDELNQKKSQLRENLSGLEDKLKELDSELKREQLFFKRLVRELLDDKLILNKDDFEFKLTPTALLVNGRKQSKKYFLKYKKIIEKHRGKKLDKDTKFQIINRK